MIKSIDNLLNTSKTFCMLPWISINTSPTGAVVPCCIAQQSHKVGDVNQSSLNDLVNSDGMKKLRLDMINGAPNPLCSTCYRHEEHGIKSLRKSVNELKGAIAFGKYFDEVIDDTDDTGKLNQFKMRYFDIRLNNICNMKCRTCNSGYSSQWENEDAKQGKKVITVQAEQRSKYVEYILTHIPYMDIAYFAGGEPLITEEHYTMLEEMIRLGRTDIRLRYNSNISNLKYKDKDLLNIWSHFTQKIELFASIDDFGKRAEYIRSGTNWQQLEENFRKLKNVPYVSMQVSTVLSIFNFVTISEFYNYLIDNNLYTPRDDTFMIYNMVDPAYFTVSVLPAHLKTQGFEAITKLITRMHGIGFQKHHLQQLVNAKKWALSDTTWQTHKEKFQSETNRLDLLRNEKFVEVFPHLAELMQ